MEARPQTITSEALKALRFDREDVLTEANAKESRNQHLKLGMTLGNLYKNKVQIVFKSLQGLHSVNTTIWATTDKNVVLKGGTFIPICCILQVIV